MRASHDAAEEDRRGREVAALLAAHRQSLSESIRQLEDDCGQLAAAVELVIGTLRSGHTVLVAGNGGSAAEAQHFAAELVGRFRRERPAYPALALTTDTSILTAIGNDYSFEEVFSRQIEGLGRPGDLFIAFSTSGESANLVRAAEACRGRGIATLAVTGSRPSSLGSAADIALLMPATDTPTVQEMHTLITHVLCDLAEEALTQG
jgi:D-sedoheptulose 7-phosphate isomerase